MMLTYLNEGMSKAQVSRLTFTAPDRVYAWLKRFRERGIEGLRDKPRSGRPSLLDRSAYDALQQKNRGLTEFTVRGSSSRRKYYSAG